MNGQKCRSLPYLGILVILVGVVALTLLENAVLADKADESVCLAAVDHWSYTGIGWSLGLESVIVSVNDALELAQRPPWVKTSLNFDAHAYELIARHFPEVADRLKSALASGRVEIVGGTYGQPLGTMFGGESNIRQVLQGRLAIKNALGYDVVTFLEEEEFSHPQLPQILAGAGFKYASLAQADTWGKAGVPQIEINSMNWKGKDGTTILCHPKNSLFDLAPGVAVPSSETLARLRKSGKPLIVNWEEFGWDSEEAPWWPGAAHYYGEFAKQISVEFVTMKEYFEKYVKNPSKTTYLNMDSFNKSLAWGIGGDQMRILDRRVEATLLAAERFDAVACGLGAKSGERQLDKAWKDLLVSQSHDVGLCEYSRWYGGLALPEKRVYSLHNYTWGSIGFGYIDRARKEGQAVLDASLKYIAHRIHTPKNSRDCKEIIVFNSNSWDRSGIALSGRVYPIRQKGENVLVRDSSGKVVPSQIVRSQKAFGGQLTMADVAFVADKVPSVGYDTYTVETVHKPLPTPATDLRVDEQKLTMENEHVVVRLDPITGAVCSLVNKSTGRECLDAQNGAFRFKGRPNRSYPLRSGSPEEYDSSKSQADIRWIENGPVRSTVRASHVWANMQFETRVTLCAGSPFVEIVVRVVADVPPMPTGPDISEGYWLSFKPFFPVTGTMRESLFEKSTPASPRKCELVAITGPTTRTPGSPATHDMEGPGSASRRIHTWSLV